MSRNRRYSSRRRTTVRREGENGDSKQKDRKNQGNSQEFHPYYSFHHLVQPIIDCIFCIFHIFYHNYSNLYYTKCKNLKMNTSVFILYCIGDSVSAPLRSAQNRGPLDLVRPSTLLRSVSPSYSILGTTKKESFWTLFFVVARGGFEPSTLRV